MISGKVPVIIEGGVYEDERGKMTFCNEFDMNLIKRMYIINPASTEIIRAWQGHKYESKWFFCLKGEVDIKLVQLDDFNNPPLNPPIFEFTLQEDQPKVLFVPGGFANGFKAVAEDSSLIVFSNYTISESSNDDYRYPVETWNLWNE